MKMRLLLKRNTLFWMMSATIIMYSHMPIKITRLRKT